MMFLICIFYFLVMTFVVNEFFTEWPSVSQTIEKVLTLK